MSGKPSADFEKAWALFLAGEKPHRASLLAGIHPTTFYRSKRYKDHKNRPDSGQGQLSERLILRK
jgi:hypothetical protein